MLLKSQWSLNLDKRITSVPNLSFKRNALNSKLHLLRPILTFKLPLKINYLYINQFWHPFGRRMEFGYRTMLTYRIKSVHSIHSLRWTKLFPLYISNKLLYNDLNIETVKSLTAKYYKKKNLLWTISSH